MDKTLKEQLRELPIKAWYRREIGEFGSTIRVLPFRSDPDAKDRGWIPLHDIQEFLK